MLDRSNVIHEVDHDIGALRIINGDTMNMTNHSSKFRLSQNNYLLRKIKIPITANIWSSGRSLMIPTKVNCLLEFIRIGFRWSVHNKKTQGQLGNYEGQNLTVLTWELIDIVHQKIVLNVTECTSMREIGIYFTCPVTSEDVMFWYVNFFIINCISKPGFCKSNDANIFPLCTFSKEVSFCFFVFDILGIGYFEALFWSQCSEQGAIVKSGLPFKRTKFYSKFYSIFCQMNTTV